MMGPGDILSRSAKRFGDKPALIFEGRQFSYTELDGLANRVASGLQSLGVEPQNRVSIYSQNRWEWLVSYHGILKAGAVVNPVNIMLTPEEVAYVLNDCGASAVLTSGDKTPRLVELTQDVPSLGHVVSFDGGQAGAIEFGGLIDRSPDGSATTPPQPDALSVIAYTSGTTGHPKGAMLSQRSVLLNYALLATMHVRTSADVVVTGLPAAHVYGAIVINSIFLAGGTVVLMERFDPGEALGLIEEHRATLFEGVPTMYATMLAHPDIHSADLSSLTRCTEGGQTMPVANIEEWERRTGVPLLELWGMTELAGAGTTHPLYAPNVHGSIGVSLPGIEVRVAGMKDPNVTVAPGTPGELMVRGPIVMLGYYGNPEATAEAIEPDGWLHTGDVAVVDEYGYFRVIDRAKDMIITGGYNVYPAEIERVLGAHPSVAMVAVGGVPDGVKGEVARAYVVLRSGATLTEPEVIDFCRQHLAAYKLPRSVSFVPDLPKTSSGKIMRRELSKLD